jgi:hypothetical protein
VPDAILQRAAAKPLDRVSDRPRCADVVKDCRFRMLLEQAFRQQRGEEITIDESAIGVAVPGDSDVSSSFDHAVHDEGAVLGQHRVRFVVWEFAVGDEVVLIEL